ncbi:MAG TPA: trypsin-like peptidase domain-containing protein [Gaiellaceae bacterium]|nr:trypsin-like peptidase domain-containing protein [Gaiellaceae bacterium]
MNPRSAFRRFLPLVAAAVVGTGAGVAAYTLSNNGSSANTPKVVIPAQQASSTSNANSLTQIYQADAPGVVDITVTSSAGSSAPSGGFNPFGVPTNPQQQPQQEAEGTGFVIDKNGDILTAEHVVNNESSIKVAFEDGSTATATLVGSDKSTDTAVIHVNVDPSKLHPLALGDSSSVLPGQEVAAIGSPFGLPETMTSGIVSAINRTITAPNNFSIPGSIQTDAAINHGNSGGPLIDVATNTVIGINDQIESDTNDNSGVGFAVPINDSKSAAHTLIAGGTVRHAYMGVEIGSAPGGAAVRSVVSGSPAAQAGLKAGDVITAFNGKSVLNADVLTADVTAGRPGQTVTLTVRRNGATKHLSLKLGAQPKSPS